ncbi:hypothetical protein TNCV_563661 [Trichonephila clavipes]|nr:hypothetical protein TNCV_563661 [Trichonephila clavipes]
MVGITQAFVLTYIVTTLKTKNTSPVTLYLTKPLITLIPFWIAETGHRKGERNVHWDLTQGWGESYCDEAHFWLNGYVNKQNCRIWSEANPQVYVETPLHPEKLTVWCALWAGGILLQKR